MIRKIVSVKEKSIREKSKPLLKFDQKTKQLIADLKDTLYAQKDPEGVGLAGSQIGENFRIFAMKPKKNVTIIINPEIVSISKEKISKKESKSLEGCLSLPDYYGPLRRAKNITIKYRDENWQEQQKEFKDFDAQIVQHEIDHLDGIIFVDHILKEKLPLYRFDGEEWEEVSLT